MADREFSAYCSSCGKSSYVRLRLPYSIEGVGDTVYCKNQDCGGIAVLVKELDRR